MRPLMIAGCLVLLSLSGCAWMKGASTSARPAGAQVAVPPESGPQSPESPPAASPSQQVTSVDDTGPSSSVGVEHRVSAPPVSSTADSTPEKSNSATGKRPIKQTGTAPAPATTSNKAPAPPALDLAELEQRLRDTHAIGVFTKLSLKNQVDDLLSEFRTFYQGSNKHPSAELRQRYDLLLLKVLSLLQDSDPALAAAIASSREAIWSILADPEKFAQL
jgi:hypothetical protein